jgi:ATP-dependent Lon protease
MENNFDFQERRFSEIMDGDAEFIPLLSQEEEDIMNAENVPEILPVMPLRNMVLFPGVVIPITIGREKSIKLIKDAYKGNKTIGVVAQTDASIEDPDTKDFYKIGTVAQIIRLLQMPDGSTSAIIQGKKRFSLIEIIQQEPYYKAKVKQFESAKSPGKSKEFNALISSIKDLAIQIIKLSPHIPSDATFAIRNIESPVFMVNFVAANLNIDIAEKQKLLETADLVDRANIVLLHLTKELQILELKNQIQDKVKIDLDKQQRDYFLSQQLKTIQDELGVNPNEQQVSELKEKSKNKKWPKEVEDTFHKELLKLQRMNPMAAEHSIQANYLEVMVELPWDEYTEDNFDLGHGRGVLDEDHYGLDKVKERIIEFLAVLKLKKDIKSPILCLVGPPGVGKTSLGKSISKAVGRHYVRMSLGGLRDEAEIRGHRKTYIGAMPGRIIQSIRKAKSSNPVFVLDEIDKVLGMNINGDPWLHCWKCLILNRTGPFMIISLR